MDLILRELERKDLNEINKMRNNKNIIDTLGANFRYINNEVDEKWFDNYMNNRSNTVRCAIIIKNNFAGLITLSNIDHLNRTSCLHIMIKEEYQNLGVGSIVIKKMLKHAFYNLNLNRVELEVLYDNIRAIHVYEKNGFKKEGVRRQIVYKNGKYVDLINMSILKSEYEENSNE